MNTYTKGNILPRMGHEFTNIVIPINLYTPPILVSGDLDVVDLPMFNILCTLLLSVYLNLDYH